MLWFKSTKIREEDVNYTYEEQLSILKKDLQVLKSRLIKMDSEILDLATSQDIIRNKVLRKIQNKKPTEEENEDIDGFGIPKS